MLMEMNKEVHRGAGVEQLERLLQERWKNMTQLPSLHPLHIPIINPLLPSFNYFPAVEFPPHAPSPSPAMIDAAKTPRSPGQVAEVMAGHQNGGGVLPQFECFPGKGGRGAENYKELMKMGTTTTTWCGSGTSVGGVIGLRGGEGSCVTAITGSQERSGLVYSRL